MQKSELSSISPVDGRYRKVTKDLAKYFSEYGLIKYRVQVEIEYFILLFKTLPELAEINIENHRKTLENIYINFSERDALQIKDTEKTTNHDVKSVEYFVKQKIQDAGLEKYIEFVHFGLTSQDINNTAIPLSFKEGNENVIFPAIDSVILKLQNLASDWNNITMLARTHGQPASPTKLGKEISVFTNRLMQQIGLFKTIPYSAKFGGATGNLNAHFIAYPEINWHNFAQNYVEKLGLHRSFPTTQIEHYDNLAAQFDSFKRINTILIDLCRDIWTYISFDYFKQKIKEGEVGSSAMPHKVNPIDFENAEGNLMLANSIFEFLAAKLPISRLQRDLTDSTVLRNVGVPLAHSLIAYKSILRGLEKIIVNNEKINADLDENWAVVAEAIQTILRREKIEKPYELLKELTRTNEKITKDKIKNFIQNLKISPEIKEELLNISPFNFVGK
ncbi:MAG: adenylosuccinate lyase [Bacteroidetes bacterium]|nr:adenylosuccinate lyase [Bacteroidota bacterium]